MNYQEIKKVFYGYTNLVPSKWHFDNTINTDGCRANKVLVVPEIDPVTLMHEKS